jgi:O-antigen ligase
MRHAFLLLQAVVIAAVIQCCVQLTGFLAGWEKAAGGLSEHPGHTALWFSLALGTLVLSQPFTARTLALRTPLAILILVGLVNTAARSAIAGTLLGLMAGAVLMLVGLRHRGTRIALGAATVAILVGGILIGSQTHVGTRINEAYRAFTTPYVDGEFPMDQTRPLWWKIGLSEWRAHPVIGTGIGSAAAVIPTNPEVQRIVEQHPANTKVIRDDYHSLYVTTLAESGLIGVILLAGWLGMLARDILRNGPLTPILLVGLLAYLGYGFFNTTLFSGRLVAFTATLMAFSIIRFPEQMKIRELPK